MKFSSLVPISYLAALVLTGCSGAPSWLEGDWVFDADRSQREASAANTAKPGDLMGGLTAMLQNMITPQLQGMELTFTATDEINTVQGQGKDYKYQIVKESSTECSLKKGGRLGGNLLSRAGDEVYTFATGGLSNFKIYFRRKS